MSNLAIYPGAIVLANFQSLWAAGAGLFHEFVVPRRFKIVLKSPDGPHENST